MVYETLLKLAIAKGVWEELEDDYLGWDETAIEYLKKCEGEVEYNEGSIWLSITGTPKMEDDCIEYQAKVRYKKVPEFTVTYEQEYNEILERGAGDAVDELEFWLSSRIDEFLRSKGVNEETDISLSDFWRENEVRIRTDLEKSLDRDSEWIEAKEFLAIKKCSGKVDLGKDLGEIKYTVKFNNFDDQDYMDYDLTLDYPAFDRVDIPFELPEDLKDDGAEQEIEIAQFVLEEIYNYLQDFIFSDEQLDEAADLRSEIIDCLLKGSFSDEYGFLITSKGLVGNDEIAFKVNAQYGPEDLPQNDDEESFWINYLLELDIRGENKKTKFQAEIFVGTDNQEQAEMLAEFIEEEINGNLNEADNFKITKDDIKYAIKNGVYSKKFPSVMLGCFYKKDKDYIAIDINPDPNKNKALKDPDYFTDRDTFNLAYTFTVNANNVKRQEGFTVEGNKLGELEDDEFAELVADLVWETYKLVSQGEIGGELDEDCNELDEANKFNFTKNELKKAILKGKYSDVMPDVLEYCILKKGAAFVELKLVSKLDSGDLEDLKTSDDIDFTYELKMSVGGPIKKISVDAHYDSIEKINKKDYAEDAAGFLLKKGKDEFNRPVKIDELKITRDDIKKAILNGKYSDEDPKIMLKCFVEKDDEFIAVKMDEGWHGETIFNDPEHFKIKNGYEVNFEVHFEQGIYVGHRRFSIELDENLELVDKDFADEIADFLWKLYTDWVQDDYPDKPTLNPENDPAVVRKYWK